MRAFSSITAVEVMENYKTIYKYNLLDCFLPVNGRRQRYITIIIIIVPIIVASTHSVKL
jgi:hypothetical protein